MLESFMVAAVAVVRFTLPCFAADSVGCSPALEPQPIGAVYQSALIGWTVGGGPETLAVRTYFSPDSVTGCAPPDCPACRPDSLEFEDRGAPWQLALVTSDGPAGPWSCQSNMISRNWPVSVDPSPSAYVVTRVEWYDVMGRRVEGDKFRPFAPSGVYWCRAWVNGLPRVWKFIHRR